MHQDLKNLPLTHNTCTPSWEGIPNTLKLTILDFLSPTESLPGITAYKDAIHHFGKYIIQQLRSELLPYKIIKANNFHTTAIRRDGALFSWGRNSYGQVGLGHTDDQNSPQCIAQEYFQGKTIQSFHTEGKFNRML